MDEKVAFGIIGCGSIARVHARAIKAIQNAELVAVSSRTTEQAKNFAREFKCEYHVDCDLLLKRPDIDVISICLPSGLHADMAMRVAEADKHAIVEKPMDVSLEKADRMIGTFNERNLKLCIIFQRRFEDDIILAKKILDKKALGEICFGGCYIKWYRSQDYYDSGTWRGTWELDGGGVLMNQSIHYVDLMQYLLGPVEEVCAHGGTFAHKNIQVEDQIVATIKYKNGALGVVEATTNAYPGLGSRIDIYGSQGSLVIENDSISSYNLKSGQIHIAPAKDVGVGAGSPEISFKSHQKQYEQMIEALRTGRDLAVDGAEGRKALEIVLAMYKSVFYGKPVKLPLSDSLFLAELIY